MAWYHNTSLARLGTALLTANRAIAWALRHACDPASTAGKRPLRTNENYHGCLTVAHQLGGYLPEAARFMTTRATAS